MVQQKRFGGNTMTTYEKGRNAPNKSPGVIQVTAWVILNFIFDVWFIQMLLS